MWCGQLFLTVDFQFKNPRRKDRNRNSPFGKNYSNEYCKKESPMMLRLVGENTVRNRVYAQYLYFPRRYYLTTKGTIITL